MHHTMKTLKIHQIIKQQTNQIILAVRLHRMTLHFTIKKTIAPLKEKSER